MEIITKLAAAPHILQHMNTAKYGYSEGICGEIPRFLPLCDKNGCLSRQGEARSDGDEIVSGGAAGADCCAAPF